MGKRIPNLEAAIDLCRNKNIKFNYYETKRSSHIKFYIEGIDGYVLISKKKDNSDKIRKSLEKHLTASACI